MGGDVRLQEGGPAALLGGGDSLHGPRASRNGQGAAEHIVSPCCAHAGMKWGARTSPTSVGVSDMVVVACGGCAVGSGGRRERWAGLQKLGGYAGVCATAGAVCGVSGEVVVVEGKNGASASTATAARASGAWA